MQLRRDAATRLVQTRTGQLISSEGLDKLRNLTGIDDKIKEWTKTLINAQKRAYNFIRNLAFYRTGDP